MSEELFWNRCKQYACCLSGHRALPSGAQLERLRQNLKKTIAKLAQEEITLFYVGGALGFDTLAAMTVLEMKAYFPQIRLYLALPCPEQHERWSKEDKALYEQIKEHADRVDYVSKQYTPDCMKKRNYYMVDHSCVCAYYLIHSMRSGTAQTVHYAGKQGSRLIDLSAEEPEDSWESSDLLQKTLRWKEEVTVREFYQKKEGEC